MSAPSHRRPRAFRGGGKPAPLPSPRPLATPRLLPSAATPPNNLPVQLTSFIGRDDAVAQLTHLLPTTRLLTLTGPGGSGKTRLAIHLAAQRAPTFAHGLAWVDLAPLSDPARLPAHVAAAVGVLENPREPLLDTLVGALYPKQLLLLLDNCDHLADACAALLAALLPRCPRLTLLATSRRPLHLTGETVWHVPPLSLPDIGSRPPDPSLILDAEAVRLFVDRAAAVRPTFALTAHNAPAVAHICRRLDGLPLAIELAAARVTVLTAEQIAARLDDRFPLLSAGSHAAPPRHQTLRAAIDWSYDLLTPSEQLLLQRLAVFVGGFTLEAVEAICAEPTHTDQAASSQPPASSPTPDAAAPPPLERFQILDVLARLVDHSLVVAVEHGPAMRYHLLETIREYAAERLAAAGAADRLRSRHLAYFVALAEDIETRQRGAERLACFDRLEREHHNIRAALAWSLEQPHRAVDGLRLAAALDWFWQIRGYTAEGRGWLSHLLAATPDESNIPRAHAYGALAHLMMFEGNHAAARGYLTRAIAQLRSLADTRRLAETLAYLCICARSLRDPASSAAAADESLALYTALGDEWGIADALRVKATLLVLLAPQEHETARALATESLVRFRRTGDRWTAAYPHSTLAGVARIQGDFAAAQASLTEALDRFREVGDWWGSAFGCHLLASLAHHQGDLETAMALYADSLEAWRGRGEKVSTTGCLAAIAEVLSLRGRPEPAIRLLATAETSRAAAQGNWIYPYTTSDYQRALGVIRGQVDELTFARAWAEGELMTLDDAIVYATEILALLRSPEPPARTASARSSSQHSSLAGLTLRQADVAALTAQGFTNRQIGDALVITERTVEYHVGQIRARLGVTSRAQLAVWAVENGLLPTTPRPPDA